MNFSANLVNEYRRIKKNHWAAEKSHFVRVVLPGSVMRVFAKNTRPLLIQRIEKVDLKALKRIKTHDDFKKQFELELKRVAAAIKATNERNPRVQPGYKWGHATKILCLYLRDIVLHSHYFSLDTSSRLSHFLYAPIDSVVIGRLRRLGVPVSFKRIKDIDTPNKFYYVQELLQQASDKAGVPAIWFDDNWAQRVQSADGRLNNTA